MSKVEILFNQSSPELTDVTNYVIEVTAHQEILCIGGSALTKSDVLVVTKTDLAPHVGASLEVMDRDATRIRNGRPFVFSSLRQRKGVAEIATLLAQIGGLDVSADTKAGAV